MPVTKQISITRPGGVIVRDVAVLYSSRNVYK